VVYGLIVLESGAGRQREAESHTTLNCEDAAAPRYAGLPAGQRPHHGERDTR